MKYHHRVISWTPLLPTGTEKHQEDEVHKKQGNTHPLQNHVLVRKKEMIVFDDIHYREVTNPPRELAYLVGTGVIYDKMRT